MEEQDKGDLGQQETPKTPEKQGTPKVPLK